MYVYNDTNKFFLMRINPINPNIYKCISAFLYQL